MILSSDFTRVIHIVLFTVGDSISSSIYTHLSLASECEGILAVSFYEQERSLSWCSILFGCPEFFAFAPTNTNAFVT